MVLSICVIVLTLLVYIPVFMNKLGIVVETRSGSFILIANVICSFLSLLSLLLLTSASVRKGLFVTSNTILIKLCIVLLAAYVFWVFYLLAMVHISGI